MRGILILSFVVALSAVVVDLSSPIQRIAFGSCNQHYRHQPAWRAITATSPDVFVWLGDVVYTDVFRPWPPFLFPAPLDHVEKVFALQKNQPDYARFIQSTPVLGTWDDHDSCANDAGAECDARADHRPLFLDFLDEPRDSARAQRSAGVYTSYTWGTGDRQASLILLDARTFRGPPLTGDMLEREDRLWLESVLRNSTSKLHFFGSGIQVLSADKFFTEKWTSHLESKSRLFNLLASFKTPGVIFLSGDVHMSELMRDDCTAMGYPIIELTSSGLTHSCETQVPFGLCHVILHSVFADRFRMKPQWLDDAANARGSIVARERMQGLRHSDRLLWAPSPALIIDHPNASLAVNYPAFQRGQADFLETHDTQAEFVYGDLNFGMIEIDWDRSLISMQARRAWDGRIAFEVALDFTTLVAPKNFQINASDHLPAHCHDPPASRLWPIEFYVKMAAISITGVVVLVTLVGVLFQLMRSFRHQRELALKTSIDKKST